MIGHSLLSKNAKIIKIGFEWIVLKKHVFGSFNLNNSEKHRLSFEDIFWGTLDTYTKKWTHPRQFWGGGVHGKVSWLIAYNTANKFDVLIIVTLFFLLLDTNDQIYNDEVFHDSNGCNSTLCVLCKRGKEFYTTESEKNRTRRSFHRDLSFEKSFLRMHIGAWTKSCS